MKSWTKIQKIGVLLLAVLILIYLIKEALENGDFKIFLSAASLVHEGISPYKEWITVSEGSSGLYYYSPFWAMLLIPLSYLPQFVVHFSWLLLNMWFLSRLYKLFQNYIQPFNLTTKQHKIIVILSMAVSIRFLLYNIGMLQMTIFILWTCFESISLIKKDKLILGSLLLALAINIKLLPLVLVPYLIWKKEFTSCIAVILFNILFLLLPSVFIGWDFNLQLHIDWWAQINPTKENLNFETSLGIHSLSALIPSLLSETISKVDLRRNLFDLNPELIKSIIQGVQIVLIGSVLFIIGLPKKMGSSFQFKELRELGYLMLLIPIIFPHQQKYAFYLALPAQIYLITYLVILAKSKPKKWIYSPIAILFLLAFILMTISTDGIVGKKLYQIGQHYKLITHGTFLLVISLLLSHPKKLLLKK